jgi:hypothetical protein
VTGALDKQISITLFDDLQARVPDSRITDLRTFASAELLTARADVKAELKLVCFASFGGKRTKLGSLRSDGNMVETFSIVVDYDGEQMSFDEAVAAARRARVACVLATTFGYQADKPRWRGIAPLDVPLNKNTKAEFNKLVSRLAGIFGVDMDGASWTLSQSWYVGARRGNDDHTVLIIDGDAIDTRPDLDSNAKPKPSSKKRRVTDTHQVPDDDAKEAGNLPIAQDLAALLDAITRGAGSHPAIVSAAGKLASQGVPLSTAIITIRAAANGRPAADRDAGWHEMLADLERNVRYSYDKFAEQEAALEGGLLIPFMPPGQRAGTPPPPPPPGGGAGSGGGSTPPPQPPPQARGMLRNRAPKFAGNLANVVTMLLQNVQLVGHVAFDMFTLNVMLMGPLPGTGNWEKPRPLTEDDISCLQDFLQTTAQMGRVGREVCMQGVNHVAHKHRFHPVRDYLERLQWDGIERVAKLFRVYFNAELPEFDPRDPDAVGITTATSCTSTPLAAVS